MPKHVPLAFLGVLCAASVAVAAEVVKGTAPSEAEQMAEKWQQIATPAVHHKMLAQLTGTWETKVKMWMSPGAPPQESDGVSVNRMVLGDRWLEQEFEGSMLGQPFHGIGYTGYDNYKNQLVSWWMDTSTTAGMMMTGHSAEDGKSMAFTGTMDDFMSGNPVRMQEVLTIVDADHHNLEMWTTGPDGQSFKSMEIAYSRRK